MNLCPMQQIMLFRISNVSLLFATSLVAAGRVMSMFVHAVVHAPWMHAYVHACLNISEVQCWNSEV